jgi:hypothetical protein
VQVQYDRYSSATGGSKHCCWQQGACHAVWKASRLQHVCSQSSVACLDGEQVWLCGCYIVALSSHRRGARLCVSVAAAQPHLVLVM